MKVLLAVSGGIAAYKAPELVRRLRDNGHEVRCAITSAATNLVAPAALSVVTGHRVWDSLWDPDGRMPHIDLPRWCECMVVAPATADVLGKIALGLADDLVTTIALALERDRPLLVAPAMNTQMWEHPAVQTNIHTLRERKVTIIDPVIGDLACKEQGIGAMADIPTIVEAVGVCR